MDDRGGGKLRFFDCNMRLGRAGVVRPEHILDAAGLLGEMDYAGLDSALVYHAFSQEWDAGGGNAKLLEEIGDCGRFYPCFVPLPHATHEMPSLAEFGADLKRRHGAARLYPKAHSYSLQDWCAGEMLDVLEALRLPVLIELAQTDWDELAGVLAAHPRLPVIVLATSYRVNRYLYPLWEKFDNLYLETATFQIMRGIEDVCRRFGPQRLVFGTGLPLLDAGGPLAQVTYAELPVAHKRMIAGETLAELLGLEHWGGAA
ncbi:MAG: amidohydrolase family protein [Armatimonadota bacterium]